MPIVEHEVFIGTMYEHPNGDLTLDDTQGVPKQFNVWVTERQGDELDEIEDHEFSLNESAAAYRRAEQLAEKFNCGLTEL